MIKVFTNGALTENFTTTVLGLAKWQISDHKCSVLYNSQIEELSLNLVLNPPFFQTDVGGQLFFFVSQFRLFLLIISFPNQGQLSCRF